MCANDNDEVCWQKSYFQLIKSLYLTSVPITSHKLAPGNKKFTKTFKKVITILDSPQKTKNNRPKK